MLLSHPGTEIFDKRVLRVMTALGRVSIPMHGRQLARVTGLDRTTTAKLLGELAAAGALTVIHAGPTLQYLPNRAHFYWQMLTMLQEFDSRLRAELKSLLPATGGGEEGQRSVFIFGSVARGQERSDSDLDVGVIVETDAEAVRVEDYIYSGFGERMQAWTGNVLGPFVTTWSQVQAMAQAADPLLDSWEADGDTLAGRSVQELIGEARARA